MVIDRMKAAVRLLPVVLPVVFVLMFFGYASPKFDIILYTDHIVGESVGRAFLCPPEAFSYNYQTSYYFGSELKTVLIPGFHYDVKSLELEYTNVESAEFKGFDVRILGFNVGYHQMKDSIALGRFETENGGGIETRLSDDGQSVHVIFLNPDTVTTLVITVPFIPASFWVIYWTVMLAIAFAGSIGLSYLWERFPAIRMHTISASGIMASIIMGCLICGSLGYVNYLDFWLNFLIFFAVSLLLNSLTLPFIGTIVTMSLILFWYTANYFVILYRSKPIMPPDLSAIGTVKEVIGGYSLAPTGEMLLGLAVVVFYSVAAVLIWRKLRKQRPGEPAKEGKTGFRKALISRTAGSLVAVALLFLCANNMVLAHLNSFQWDIKLLKSFHSEGIALTFLNSLASSRVSEPEGYSWETVRAYLQDYQAAEAPAVTGIQPTNIIMVMNEAFSDLRVVGMDPAIDVMSYIDSLDHNILEGSLYVSVFGGGTCNTEFEALTGNTLAFLGAGAYPYTENIMGPMFSLAAYFKTMGYETQAFHANHAQNWNRDRVYPNLGFNVFHSKDDYPETARAQTLHRHPADLADYLYMEEVSQELKGTPRFLFDVTMQNHSPYSSFEDVVKAEGVDHLTHNTQVYLSLIRASDREVQQLVETYRDSDEPTMIVFFGDHQPGLPQYAYNEFTAGASNLDTFRTKFFIWTNYEAPSEHNMAISANYLPWLILERGHFPLPPFVRMLGELHEKYPVISSQGVIDAEGRVYESVRELLLDPLMQRYQYVQYANLFDKLDDTWFEIPEKVEGDSAP